MKIFALSCVLISVIQLISGAFVPCSLKGAKLNECITEKINTLWFPNVKKAYPKYGIPVLDPHSLGNIQITQGTKQIGLNFTASNALFYGIKDMKVQKVDFNPKDQKFSLWYHTKRATQINDYVAKGKILLFPINGHGKANITMTNVHGKIAIKYNLVDDTKTKVKKIRIKNFDFKAKPGKGYMSFTNLFDGDAVLSKRINDVINDNAQELIPTFQPSVEQAIAKAWMKICDDFFSRVSYNDLFLP